MTKEELKTWLEGLRYYDDVSERDKSVKWILDALDAVGRTLDTERIEEEVVREKLNIDDILSLVAYATPDVPHELRMRKPFISMDDCPEFYSSDDIWRPHWKGNVGRFPGRIAFYDRLVVRA